MAATHVTTIEKFNEQLRQDMLEETRQTFLACVKEGQTVLKVSYENLAEEFPLKILLAEDNLINQKVMMGFDQKDVVDLRYHGSHQLLWWTISMATWL